MKLTFFILCISFSIFGLSPKGAYNQIHNVLSQVVMNSQQHNRIEKSLEVIKELVVNKTTVLKQAKEKAYKKAIIKEYLKNKKGK